MTPKFTDEQIVKGFECCNSVKNSCEFCPFNKEEDCQSELIKSTPDFINRIEAENEELNELYTNLSNATVQHSIDNEKDRQLLGEYQNIFLGLGYVLEEVSDPELKEIKAWKDRMIWHCRKCDELTEQLKSAKTEAYKEFVEEFKKQLSKISQHHFNLLNVEWFLDNLLKEMVGES